MRQPKKQQRAKRPKELCVPYLIRFRSHDDLELIRDAARHEQAGMQDVMGRKYPNTSIFIAQAAIEHAKRVVGKK